MYRIDNQGNDPEIGSFYEAQIDAFDLSVEIVKYKKIDDSIESLILAFGRDPFNIKQKTNYTDIIQKLLEEN